MYTEDDDKVSLKDEDSGSGYNDFYTSFDDLDDGDKKRDKKKQKKVKEQQENLKEERDFSSFYGFSDEEEEESSNDNKGKIIKIAIIAILAIAVIVLLIMFIGKASKTKGDIELINQDISLKVGEKNVISYRIIDTDSEVKSSFTSSNPSVVLVDENGEVTALSTGSAKIIVSYTIDGKTRTKECNITVTDEGNVDKTIKIAINNYKENSWSNTTVDMEVVATSVFGIESIKYAFDCESSCQYKDVVNNHITVSNTGTTKVVIEVQDKSNQKAIKTIDVKIDKEAPTAEVGKKVYEGKGEVSVCATCKDSQSGCKQSKVCKKYTSSKSNQTITVEDNAGNKGESAAFNVKVAELKEPCYLTVSDTGLVKATLREEASYYGFNSSYSGENQKSMQISINASKKGESGAKVVTYYVKNKNGSGGMCYATVIKECDCTDPSSTAANCPVTCKYSIR